MNTDDAFSVGIVGAGIGGLAAAIALRQRNINVAVYEQSATLSETGAGITMSAQACQIINVMGLREQLEALEAPMPHIGTLHYATAQRLNYDQRDIDQEIATFGTATRHVHRADLHKMLVSALQQSGTAVQLGCRLAAVTQNAEGVDLIFSNNRQQRHDIVIGCDGLKSRVRDICFATEPPTYTGMVAWRGLIDRKAVADIAMDPHFAAVPSDGKLFARYPIRHGTLINYVAIASFPDAQPESWSARADLQDVLTHFEGWHEDFVRIIAATPDDRCLQWPLYTREPLDTWTHERIALLGDAAHPMTPFYGKGALMALEDAWVMGRSFEAFGDDWSRALRCYEAMRLERANHVHRLSMQRGDAYLSKDAKRRNQKPGAGYDEQAHYNALTAPLALA